MAQFIDTQGACLLLKGDWVLDHLGAIEAEMREAGPTPAPNPHIQSAIGRMDTAGAEILHELIAARNVPPEAVKDLAPRHLPLLQLVAKTAQEFPAPDAPAPPVRAAFEAVGRQTYDVGNTILDLLRFLGETTITLGSVLKHPKRLRLAAVNRHVSEAGIAAIPIVSLIAFLISIVLAYQGADQLRRFGAEIFTINMVAISVLREMGVLLTAIMIAGRSGSAFTAEIGVMKVNEEVDAMRIIGVSPFETLVVPRLLALVIAMPLLTFIADAMGLLGGGIVSVTLLDIDPGQYLSRVRQTVNLSDFFVGLSKAPVFGFFIAVVACMRGMQVSGSAESVGRLTTTSVVQSIFMVLLLDALFSILFTKLGI